MLLQIETIRSLELLNWRSSDRLVEVCVPVQSATPVGNTDADCIHVRDLCTQILFSALTIGFLIEITLLRTTTRLISRAAVATTDDWRQFRGPNGNGVYIRSTNTVYAVSTK